MIAILWLLVFRTSAWNNFWFKCWKQNFSLLKAGWNMFKLFRRHDVFSLIARKSFESPESQLTTAIRREAEFFEDFCREKKRRLDGNNANSTDDTDLLACDNVKHLPIEYVKFARLSEQQLRDNWHRFVSPKCSVYYDKLFCLNGLTFDWTTGETHISQEALNS